MKHHSPPKAAIALAIALALSTPLLRADMIMLSGVDARDNSIYSESGALSNGAAISLFAGKTNIDDDRRALLAFDLSSIVAGSTINSVSLSLTLSLAPPGSGPTTMTLHRALADWGEGASNSGLPGGGGAGAQPGDATWLHAFSPSTFWTTPGGDFVAGASATEAVGGDADVGTSYLWSGAGLIADVQAWVDGPSSNFGWALLGDEAETGSARRFNSREHPTEAVRPTLTVDFTPVPEPSRALLLLAGILAGALPRRRHARASA